jgi:hypothetical protein
MTDAPRPTRRRLQFSLSRLLLMTLVSVLASAAAGLLRDHGSSPLGFFVFLVAAPLAVMILLSVSWALRGFFSRRP